MLTICTFLWGKKYSVDYVLKLQAGLKRHLKQPHRFFVVTDYPRKFEGKDTQALPIPDVDRYLLNVQGCFVRLRIFDKKWQSQCGITDRFACMDLDAIVTGPLDPVFDRPEPFVILQGANAANPCPYNGSLMMLRPGAHQEVWSDFSLKAGFKVPFHDFPDDQGWLAAKVPKAAGWQVGTESGVYAFHKPGWPGGDALPGGARLVVFPGWRDPSKFEHLPWIKFNWA